jgi:hypothetical protein
MNEQVTISFGNNEKNIRKRYTLNAAKLQNIANVAATLLKYSALCAAWIFDVEGTGQRKLERIFLFNSLINKKFLLLSATPWP